MCSTVPSSVRPSSDRHPSDPPSVPPPSPRPAPFARQVLAHPDTLYAGTSVLCMTWVYFVGYFGYGIIWVPILSFVWLSAQVGWPCGEGEMAGQTGGWLGRRAVVVGCVCASGSNRHDGTAASHTRPLHRPCAHTAERDTQRERRERERERRESRPLSDNRSLARSFARSFVRLVGGSQYWRDKVEKQEKARIALKNCGKREDIKQLFAGVVPSWVKFPDVESADWVQAICGNEPKHHRCECLSVSFSRVRFRPDPYPCKDVSCDACAGTTVLDCSGLVQPEGEGDHRRGDAALTSGEMGVPPTKRQSVSLGARAGHLRYLVAAPEHRNRREDDRHNQPVR